MGDTEDTQKVKIGGWVPVKLWERVQQTQYSKPTEAVRRGFQLILIEAGIPIDGDNLGTYGDNLGTSGDIGDKIELAVLRARNKELEAHLSTTQAQVTYLQERLIYTQEDHRNYMLQIQTVINKNLLEPPRTWWQKIRRKK